MKIIYLIQSNTSNIRYNIPNGSNVMLLQWQKDFIKTTEFPCIHLPNSSWASGRNKLYEYSKNYEYEYYIFLDDDVINVNFKLEDFEQMLYRYKPERAVPFLADWYYFKEYEFHKDKTIFNTKYVDHCFMALSNNAASTLLPYTTKFDKTNWWESSEDFCNRYNKKFESTLLFKNMCIKNTNHSKYPQKSGRRLEQKIVPIL